MTLEQSLYAFLVTNTAIVALVGGRVYPVAIRDATLKTYPVIIYRRTARSPIMELAGETMLDVSIEISTWDTDYTEVKAAANTVAEELTSFEGLLGGGLEIMTVKFETEEDDFIEDPLLFGVRQTFVFTYQSAP